MRSTTLATDIRRSRRDLDGILALEAVQRSIGLGALVAVAIHAAAVSRDQRASMIICLVVVLALSHLVFAYRLRTGADLLRRDLTLAQANDAGSGPYRSAPLPRTSPDARVWWRNFPDEALVTSALTAGGILALFLT
jgi:hypothetical protein